MNLIAIPCAIFGCHGNFECGHDPVDLSHGCTLNAHDICPCCQARATHPEPASADPTTSLNCPPDPDAPQDDIPDTEDAFCDACGGDGLVNLSDHPELWGEDCLSEPDQSIPCPYCSH